MVAKPGTAQKISDTGGYLPNEYILSSIGMAPINDPEIAVYIAIDSPIGTNNYGALSTDNPIQDDQLLKHKINTI